MNRALREIEKQWSRSLVPSPKRLIVNDATYEKLHELLSSNPRGLLADFDEMSGWLSSLDKENRKGEREFYLSAWDGNTTCNIDRIGRGSIYVPACCLSVFANIQPKRLGAYLSGLNGKGLALSDDGMIQRFQLLIKPDVPKFRWVDRPADAEAEKQFENIIRCLTSLSADKPPQFRFNEDAQEIFISWYVRNEERIRGGELSPLMAGHLSKYGSLFPSLALLFELAERAAEYSIQNEVLDGFGGFLSPARLLVSTENAIRAFNWMHYLESHANRIYSVTGTPEQWAAKQLSEKIRSRAVDSTVFSVRDIEHKDWRGLNSTERVKNACSNLEKAGWLRKLIQMPAKSPKGGRPPSLRYEINPKVYQMKDDSDTE